MNNLALNNNKHIFKFRSKILVFYKLSSSVCSVNAFMRVAHCASVWSVSALLSVQVGSLLSVQVSSLLVSKWKHFTLFEYSYLSTDFKVWITFKFFSLIPVTYFKVSGFNCVYILLLTAISQFLVHLNNTSLGIWSLLSGHCFSFLMWFILNRSLQDIVSFCRLPKLPKFRYFL